MCQMCSKHAKMEYTVYGIKNKNQVGKKIMPISVFTERAFECAERNRMFRHTIRCQKLLQTQQ
jgi:hypothetical protein